jgi:hypothetical protein
VRTWICLAALSALAACSTPKPQGKYPPREPGCEVHVYTDDHVPTYTTENIGTAKASCDESVSDADCLRELKDQACQMGADTLWGVADKPEMQGGKKRLTGRAAHQK